MMDDAKLDTLKKEIVKAMVSNPEFRTHKGRDKLIAYIKGLGIEASMESITRGQRHIWKLALKLLELGDYEDAFKFLPSSETELKEWFKVRTENYETYREYYAKAKDELRNIGV